MISISNEPNEFCGYIFYLMHIQIIHSFCSVFTVSCSCLFVDFRFTPIALCIAWMPSKWKRVQHIPFKTISYTYDSQQRIDKSFRSFQCTQNEQCECAPKREKKATATGKTNTESGKWRWRTTTTNKCCLHEDVLAFCASITYLFCVEHCMFPKIWSFDSEEVRRERAACCMKNK